MANIAIPEIFKLHLYDCHCRQVYLGCSHDNGYARLLEDTLADQPIVENITLLEGAPFEGELATIKSSFTTTKFESLFRDSKIQISPYNNNGHQLPQQARIVLPSPNQSNGTPLVRTASNSTNNTSTPSIAAPSHVSAAPPTWANAAMSAPEFTPVPAQPVPKTAGAQAKNTILRNRLGQRVDPAITCDKTELKRVKAIKACNVHLLRGDCPYGMLPKPISHPPSTNSISRR